MKTTNQLKLAAAVAAGLALVGCGSSSDGGDDSIAKVFDCDAVTSVPRTICIGSESDLSDSKIYTDLSTALQSVQSGDTIILPAGRYEMEGGFDFNGLDSIVGLTIKGAGMDKTILDFDGTSEDSFHITNMDDLIMEDLGVYESANNAIKTKDVDGVILRRVATVWETDYSPGNGAYGLYPVLSENILVEDCYVKGSADAGVYVGQSQNIVVRGCTAEKNVAGIEIENSINADVYNNIAIGNTGGILVFNLPIAENTRYTKNVRVFDNLVESNNAPNFAVAGSNPAGVHIVPPGTGIILLAAQDVEVFNNTIKNNETMAMAVTSFFLPDGDVDNYGTEYGSILASGWNPLMKSVNIHSNTISQEKYLPQAGALEDMQQIVLGYALKGGIPDIFYDGVGELLANAGELVPFAQDEGLNASPYFNPKEFLPYDYANDGDDKSDAICISENGSATMGSVTRVDPMAEDAWELDSENNPTGPKYVLTTDTPEIFTCGGESGKDIPTAASKAVVTFDDNTSFSCGVDDAATAPDACITVEI
ncbi:MAG: right-handed parallel beta-helix repeat-containing protein [Gammaproteobacteria bacterium]|nr:right-handed parallel beta-helix repeat-containing protein [Gammaproteobacteria bacterium]